jgi:hypothetical protein
MQKKKKKKKKKKKNIRLSGKEWMLSGVQVIESPRSAVGILG